MITTMIRHNHHFFQRVSDNTGSYHGLQRTRLSLIMAGIKTKSPKLYAWLDEDLVRYVDTSDHLKVPPPVGDDHVWFCEATNTILPTTNFGQ